MKSELDKIAAKASWSIRLSVIAIVMAFWAMLLAGCGSEQAPVTLVKTLYGWETLKVQPNIITMAEHRVNREVGVELERQAKIDSLRPVCEERGHVISRMSDDIVQVSGREEELRDYPDSSILVKMKITHRRYSCKRCGIGIDEVVERDTETEVIWRRSQKDNPPFRSKHPRPPPPNQYEGGE